MSRADIERYLRQVDADLAADDLIGEILILG